MEKKLTDLLPIQKYSGEKIWGEIFDNDRGDQNLELEKKLYAIDYYKVADVENLLIQLANPKNMAKITKAIMFGGGLELHDLIETPKDVTP